MIIMRNYIEVTVVKTSSWYKIGQKLKVRYSPKAECYVTEDGKKVEALHIKGNQFY